MAMPKSKVGVSRAGKSNLGQNIKKWRGQGPGGNIYMNIKLIRWCGRSNIREERETRAGAKDLE